MAILPGFEQRLLEQGPPVRSGSRGPAGLLLRQLHRESGWLGGDGRARGP